MSRADGFLIITEDQPDHLRMTWEGSVPLSWSTHVLALDLSEDHRGLHICVTRKFPLLTRDLVIPFDSLRRLWLEVPMVPTEGLLSIDLCLTYRVENGVERTIHPRLRVKALDLQNETTDLLFRIAAIIGTSRPAAFRDSAKHRWAFYLDRSLEIGGEPLRVIELLEVDDDPSAQPIPLLEGKADYEEHEAPPLLQEAPPKGWLESLRDRADGPVPGLLMPLVVVLIIVALLGPLPAACHLAMRTGGGLAALSVVYGFGIWGVIVGSISEGEGGRLPIVLRIFAGAWGHMGWFILLGSWMDGVADGVDALKLWLPAAIALIGWLVCHGLRFERPKAEYWRSYVRDAGFVLLSGLCLWVAITA